MLKTRLYRYLVAYHSQTLALIQAQTYLQHKTDQILKYLQVFYAEVCVLCPVFQYQEGYNSWSFPLISTESDVAGSRIGSAV